MHLCQLSAQLRLIAGPREVKVVHDDEAATARQRAVVVHLGHPQRVRVCGQSRKYKLTGYWRHGVRAAAAWQPRHAKAASRQQLQLQMDRRELATVVRSRRQRERLTDSTQLFSDVRCVTRSRVGTDNLLSHLHLHDRHAICDALRTVHRLQAQRFSRKHATIAGRGLHKVARARFRFQH